MSEIPERKSFWSEADEKRWSQVFSTLIREFRRSGYPSPSSAYMSDERWLEYEARLDALEERVAALEKRKTQ